MISTNYKPLLLSPLLGGVFSGAILWFYAIYLISLELINKGGAFSLMSLIANAVVIIPIIFVLSILISYFLFFPLMWVVEKIKNKYFLREGTGWALMFLFGLIIGLFIAIWDYSQQHQWIKAIVITINFSFGLMFNMSLYSILTGKVKIKENNNF